MDRQPSQEFKTIAPLVVVGGFLESYSYVTRDGVLANAQTGNIARIGISLASGNPLMALRYLIPVLTFVIGVLLSLRIRIYFRSHPSDRLHWRHIPILIEMVLLFLVAFIPENRYDVPATVLISFVCSIQVSSFRKFHGNAFASTMCTGNLRSGTENLSKYIETGDKAALKKCLSYYLIDVIFACSAMLGYLMTKTFRCKAVWFCLLPLMVVFFLMLRKNHAAAQTA